MPVPSHPLQRCGRTDSVSIHTNPACLPSISDELSFTGKADCCGQNSAEMRGTTTGLCALGPSVLARAQRPLYSPSPHCTRSLPCLRAASFQVQLKPNRPLSGSQPSLWPQFPHWERMGVWRLLETLCFLCPKDLAILWGLPPTQPPGQPCWVRCSLLWLGARG